MRTTSLGSISSVVVLVLVVFFEEEGVDEVMRGRSGSAIGPGAGLLGLPGS